MYRHLAAIRLSALPPALRWLWCGLLALLLAWPALAQNIHTVAGGGPDPVSPLPWVQGVARDGTGHLYVALGDHTVHRVNIATGAANRIAGTGAAGFGGDGAAASAAQLSNPQGLAVDAAGNLYIADADNHRIRKVDAATGNISTVAGDGTQGFGGDGAAATAAQLDSPNGIAVDSLGNLFIGDSGNVSGSGNHRVRKVDAATGDISTVAGDGTDGGGGDGGAATAAQLSNPFGVAVDAAGNLYIADAYNHRIRKVDAATGDISTVAGDGTQGFGGDGAAATAAQLDTPRKVAVDAAGNLYIADLANLRIRKVDAATGFISTVAGAGAAGFTGDGVAATAARLDEPGDVVVDAPPGHLYIADRLGSRVRRVDAATGRISTTGSFGAEDPATAVGLGYPSAVAVDAAGNFYFADVGRQRIFKVDAATGMLRTVAGGGVAAFGGDGGPATAVQLSNPFGLAVSAAGQLYIADTDNHRVLKVDLATGIVSTVAGDGNMGYSGDGGPAAAAQLSFPYGVAVDAAGQLYIADTLNQRIRKVDGATGTISTVAGQGTLGYSGDGGLATAAEIAFPMAVSVDATGQLYIADSFNLVVRKVDATTRNISTVAGGGAGGDGGPATAAQLCSVAGVAVDAAGHLYIAQPCGHRIRKVDAVTGTISTWAGNGSQGHGGDGGPATAAQLDGPTGIAVDAAGRVYIADFYNFRIRKVDTGYTLPGAPGTVTAVAGDGAATVRWVAPASNGGIPLGSYTVSAVSDPGKTCTVGSGNPLPTTCTVTGLANGTPYAFTVKATNALGDSVASAAIAVVTPAASGGGGGPATLPVTDPGSTVRITDPTLTIVVSPGAAGATIVLPPGTGSSTPVALQISINNQPLQVQALPGTQLRIAQVNGQNVLVLVVLQGWASMAASAEGQPMALAGQVLLSAGRAGTAIEAQPLTVAVLAGSLVPPQGSLPQVGRMGLQAGERLQVNAQGAVVSITLGSLKGDTSQPGDPMVFANLPASITVDKVFARLGGPLARLSGANLTQGLESTASGVYLLRDGGQVLQLLPTWPIGIDATLPDGMAFTPLGLLRWVRGGVVVQFAPAVADLAGLASAITALLPDAQTRLGAEGAIQLRTGGHTYVLKPGWTGAGASTGTPQIGVDEQGRIFLQVGAGARQLLLPALLSTTQASAIFQAALPGATLAVQAASNEGAFTITLAGQAWRLVPQWVLPEGAEAQPPAAAASWWLGADGLLYLKLGSQVQGVRVAP